MKSSFFAIIKCRGQYARRNVGFYDYVISVCITEIIYDGEDDVSITYVSTKPKEKWLADFENNTSDHNNNIDLLIR